MLRWNAVLAGAILSWSTACGRANSSNSGTTDDAENGQDAATMNDGTDDRARGDGQYSDSGQADVGHDPCEVTRCDGTHVVAPSHGSVSIGGTTGNDAGGTCSCVPNEGRAGLVPLCSACSCGDSGLCVSSSGVRGSCH